MMVRVRYSIGLLFLVLSATAVRADGVALGEEVKPGDCFRYEIGLVVEGKLKVQRDGKIEDLPVRATAKHIFAERTETPDAAGGVGMAVRQYENATSASETAGEKSERSLAAERRLIVAKRNNQGSLHYSPAGPLTREELELVAEHFDTLCLPALLPGQELNPGQSWAVRAEAVQHACLFEGLIKHALVGKLVEVKDGVASFTIEGTAEGIEYGAHARLTIAAQGTFDVATKRITKLTWEQYDQRDLGPASPATEIKATVTIQRAVLPEEPKELNADARQAIPASDATIPAAMTQLRYLDSNGRFHFRYGRDWHVVGRTRDHLVLRLLDKGDFTAQATLTTWKKSASGQHSSPDEFKRVLAQLPNWQPEKILVDAEQPHSDGHWLYRLTAAGQQDGIAVVQSFYLLAGPTGDQVAITVVARQEKSAALGTRDLELVKSIAFGSEK